jgi:eukaryotic-like serine/threonine-protein kinase
MPSEILSSHYLEELAEPQGAAGLAPGVHLGRYELLGRVASGRMATVWAARLVGQRGFSKLVAIKTILPQLARDPLFERMFLDEARIASSIHHPNVCEIYEFGEERRHLYLAMEWVSGDSLAQVLDRSRAPSPLPPRIAARIIADACAGLSAAHDLTDNDGAARGIIHRDISAQNVLVADNGTVKLADFGVAKALNGSEETSSGFLKGKLAYTAPEYIETGRVDRRTDVFSMGVVLYEATLGVLPFVGDRDAAVMDAIMRGAAAPPRDVDASYPRALEQVVLRAIARDPHERFGTAEELGRALEEWLARSGPPIMQSAVTKVVMSRIGGRIEERRAELRERMRVLDEPQSTPPISCDRPTSDPPRRLPPPSVPRRRVQPIPHFMQPPLVAPPAAASTFSSAPPAPLAFSTPPHARAPAVRARPANTTPLILVAVAFMMCAALGVMGRYVLRRAPPAEGAAASQLRASTTPEESIELPDPPPPPAPVAVAPAPVAAAAIPPAADAAAATPSVPSMNASDLPNVPPAAPVQALPPTVPPNPY